MAGAAPISIENLTKRFGSVTAVDDLSFTVRPGAVTGLLGPNGSGKTTTLRMLLGLMGATAGTALINSAPYHSLTRPARVVGAGLEASSFHPGRTGLNHLLMYTPQIGVPDSRAHELLELVGLDDAKNRRAGGYSMGMRQRLALAFALLGDPEIIILDEPANGLDPQGIVWLRELLRHFAAQGKTVLVSSHVLAEVESTVDDVVIIARGRLVQASSLDSLRAQAEQAVLVRPAVPAAFAALAASRGWRVEAEPNGMVVRNVAAADIGAAAFTAGVELHQLADRNAGLEDVFLRLTAGSPSAAPAGQAA